MTRVPGRGLGTRRGARTAPDKAAPVRVEELRAGFERVRAALVEAEELLNHRVIGLEQYLEALAEQEAPVVSEVVGPAVVEIPVPTHRIQKHVRPGTTAPSERQRRVRGHEGPG
ncbi:hypothetical protein GCM10010207_61520 [Streptomyces atratus]|nr:hypothetical protein GCM10010207_61520 [Streptomyces atratus]